MPLDNNTTVLLAAGIAALSPILVAWMTNRRTRTIVADATNPIMANVAAVKRDVAAVKVVAETVQVHTNGMSERLAALSEAKGHAEGHAEGIAVGEQREKDKQS